ncbi:MAG: hypothetical protein ACP5IT_11585 [Thermoproteota archaeon]
MSEFLNELEKREKEAREIRKKMANWDFINSLPPKLRAALVYYVEKGDLRRAQKISGLSLEEFRELMKKANIPLI